MSQPFDDPFLTNGQKHVENSWPLDLAGQGCSHTINKYARLYSQFLGCVANDLFGCFKVEILNHRKNGSRYLTYLKLYPILDEAGELKYIVGLERDITAAKQIDHTKAEFISLASHQLRTPLTNISLSLDIILQDSTARINRAWRYAA